MASLLKTIRRPEYPFTAIVGQSHIKLALILSAIDPSIGGVLLAGPKGTGKSVAVRAFAEVLPEVETVQGCIFSCNPEDPTNMCESCRLGFSEDLKLPSIKRRMRVVQIPIGASEDRVIGTIDVEKAMQEGSKALQLGLLAEANQNVLYIDEVNLLPDHLVDAILDSASSGWNFVEREGISLSHPSRFILVGTMNPEEGSLRPQIADRFGIQAHAEHIINPKERMEITKRNEEFAKNPLGFREKYRQQQDELRKKIEDARKLLSQVNVPQNILESIAKVCTSLEVDGYRPDIVTVKVARALAAFNGRAVLQPSDVLTATKLALSHRTRKSGLMAPPSSPEIHEAWENTPLKKEILFSTLGPWWSLYPLRKLKRLKIKFFLKFAFISLIMFFFLYFVFSYSLGMLSDLFQIPLVSSSRVPALMGVLLGALLAIAVTVSVLKPSKKPPIYLLDLSKITMTQMLDSEEIIVAESDEPIRSPFEVRFNGEEKPFLDRGQNVFEKSLEFTETPQFEKHQRQKDQRRRQGRYYIGGNRVKTVTSASRGRYVWHQLPKARPWDIALGPTIRAAAPYQSMRKLEGLSIAIEPQDLRVKRREYRAPFSIILLVDMSFSMISSISNLSRAIHSLHRSVYRRRDRVGLIVFKGTEAFTLQAPTTNLDLIVRKLLKVKASDFTPLALGMLNAWKALKLEKLRNKDAIPMLIIVSDGIANIALKQPLTRRQNVVVMPEAQSDAFDVAQRIRRDNIRTIIINTSHSSLELLAIESETGSNKRSKPYTPTEFLMKLSKTTKGSYYGLSLRRDAEKKKAIVEENPQDWFYFETCD